MRVYLCDGLDKIVPNKYQTELMTKVALDIIRFLGDIYSKSDINSMNFHIKGVDSIKSLLVRILLNFVESDDVIEVANSRFVKLDRGMTIVGLDYMSFYKTFDQSVSAISFWYTFTDDEVTNWNGNVDNPQFGFDIN